MRWIAIILILLFSLGQSTLAQTRAEDRKLLALEDAVDFALKNYPAVSASLEGHLAAQANIGDHSSTLLNPPPAPTINKIDAAGPRQSSRNFRICFALTPGL